MRTYTVHAREAGPEHQAGSGTAAVLIRDGFCWGAFLLPTLWFLIHRLWLIAVVHLALLLLLALLLPAALAPLAVLGLQLLVGLQARDFWRAAMERRGWQPAELLVARNTEAAFARLAERRPDLARGALG